MADTFDACSRGTGLWEAKDKVLDELRATLQQSRS